MILLNNWNLFSESRCRNWSIVFWIGSLHMEKILSSTLESSELLFAFEIWEDWNVTKSSSFWIILIVHFCFCHLQGLSFFEDVFNECLCFAKMSWMLDILAFVHCFGKLRSKCLESAIRYNFSRVSFSFDLETNNWVPFITFAIDSSLSETKYWTIRFQVVPCIEEPPSPKLPHKANILNQPR